LHEIPWYQRWFGREYDELYRHRTEAEAAATVAWLTKMLRLSPPAAVLDLGCGNGRHSLPLTAYGFQVFGLDLSWFLLNQAAAKANRNFFRIRGDMRTLPFAGNAFGLILSLFTSFGYFEDRQMDVLVLREASRTLKPGGWFVLDFLNRTATLATMVPHEEREISDGRVTIRRWVDPDADRIFKEITIEQTGASLREFRESVFLYSDEQLIRMLQTAGLHPVHIYGDYNGAEFTQCSPRLILIGSKRV
jgi:SAM-dependent methyltransferase